MAEVIQWVLTGVLIIGALSWLILDLLGIAGNMPYSPHVEHSHPQEDK